MTPRRIGNRAKIDPRRLQEVIFSLLNLHLNFGSIFDPYWLPKCLPLGPLFAPKIDPQIQEASKTLPRRPKRPPRGSQVTPKRSQEAAKRPQEAPKRLPRGPRRQLRGPKKHPSGTQEHPKKPQNSRFNFPNLVLEGLGLPLFPYVVFGFSEAWDFHCSPSLGFGVRLGISASKPPSLRFSCVPFGCAWT